MNPWSNKSFPWCKQYDSMQCGVACLVMISEYYGSKYTRNELEEICHATNQGISMYGIAVSAEKIGLRTFAAIAEIHELYDINKPMILHWNQNHFVILYKVTKDDNSFNIADPRKGLVRYSYEEFKKHWISTNYEGKDAGVIMILEPTQELYRQSVEKIKERRYLYVTRYCTRTCTVSMTSCAWVQREARQHAIVKNRCFIGMTDCNALYFHRNYNKNMIVVQLF